MTFSSQSPGDEQCNNGTTPHSCRDITNLSCFGFFNSLTAGARRRIFSHSVRQNCPALLSFQLFKRSHKEKDEGEKIPFLSHYTADESPWDASVVLENNTEYCEFFFFFFLLSLFSDFHSLLDCRITLLLYQNHINTTVSRSRCAHQKPDGRLSFSIVQMNQRTSDDFQLLLQLEL